MISSTQTPDLSLDQHSKWQSEPAMGALQVA